MAWVNFATTEVSKGNLIREGKAEHTIYVTGNTEIDALKATVKDMIMKIKHEHLKWARGSRLIMLTAHRRENICEPMHHMFRANKRVSDETLGIKVIYPIHMNPAARKDSDEGLGNNDRISIIELLDVLDSHNFLSRSYLILTYSSSIQEELPFFGKSVLVMRNTTERPEEIKSGTLKLVGTTEGKFIMNLKRFNR